MVGVAAAAAASYCFLVGMNTANLESLRWIASVGVAGDFSSFRRTSSGMLWFDFDVTGVLEVFCPTIEARIGLSGVGYRYETDVLSSTILEKGDRFEARLVAGAFDCVVFAPVLKLLYNRQPMRIGDAAWEVSQLNEPCRIQEVLHMFQALL